MLAFPAFKVVHILGVALLFTSLGGLAAHAAAGGAKRDNPVFGLLTGLHGLALILLLSAGIAMVTELRVARGMVLPGWVWAKLVLWLGFGAAALLPYRGRALARSLLVALPLLGGVAAALAIFKPF